MYSTVAGDSWDLIAFKVLGSERYTQALLAANPDYVSTFIFDAGIELVIPDVAANLKANLPWNQDSS